MALSKADVNNINITPVASKAIKWNSAADGFEAGALGGSMVLLSTLTASSSATLSFTSSIDSTYNSYLFKFIHIHAATEGAHFTVNFRDGGSAFDATKTTSVFSTYHDEAGNNDPLGYKTSRHLANGTGTADLAPDLGNDNDQATSGEFLLFNPSSTTFVKHFTARSSVGHVQPSSMDFLTTGYCNVTAAIDGVQFKMDSGNIDAGVIKMYGIT
tara:strand:- start:119 stop:760 length:642 start_codon:yes stop_codon:yes gene_type:complete